MGLGGARGGRGGRGLAAPSRAAPGHQLSAKSGKKKRKEKKKSVQSVGAAPPGCGCFCARGLFLFVGLFVCFNFPSSLLPPSLRPPPSSSSTLEGKKIIIRKQNPKTQQPNPEHPKPAPAKRQLGLHRQRSVVALSPRTTTFDCTQPARLGESHKEAN